ncbi:MAG: excinuclease ABC subunit A [Sulfuriferula multivorans]|uniref:Excinuclease ABC subunit A n=1 Tax=Sulfuriferula multivorans TaxID=1559896 RepID=A0A7C9P910_9PROT|nr:excinuclease ABC subunit A [Sulfuriferula multivorans]
MSPTIQSSNRPDAQALFETGESRRFATIKQVAERKLTQLAGAATIEFLRSPPVSHLESVAGDRAGQHSIRINQQWRVCFVWTADSPTEVEIIDYH